MDRAIQKAVPKKLRQLATEVESRLGVLPNFFRLAPESPEISVNLWDFARFAYLDNPLPSLFKERLLVYLSRFCEARYCIARHVGFLAGLGHPSGDDQSPVQTIEEIVRLLRRPFPRGERLEPHIARCASYEEPLTELSEPDSVMEEAVFACAIHVYLQTPDAPRCLDALKRAFGESRFQHLNLFLAFVRTAHYWTKVHPELEIEDDVRQLLATHEVLAETMFKEPEIETCEMSPKLMDESTLLRESRDSECGIEGTNMLMDITEHKRAEEAMARLAAIVESSDDAIVSKDLNGTITSWNKGAEKLFGYTAAEVIGRPITILIPPDRMDEEPQILERIRRGERVDHYETVRHRKDSKEIDISLTVSPVRDKAGRIIGASKIARDITERKRAEEALRTAYEQESAARAEAEAANHSKDEFLAMVSHELRSPLGAILGYNRILRERLPDEAQLKQPCDVIERNARTQLQLIEDLLDTARIVNGKLRLETRPLDINPVLADAVDMMRPTAEAKGVRLQIGDCGLQSAIVMGDAARLQQIVWNLLSNAIKFTPAGGQVELRAEHADGHIRINVSDTGKGIQPEFLPRIFERFRQIDPSSPRRHGGLGLGLALVKHLAELHGGKVEAVSEGVGRGATFTVTLPLATERDLIAAEPPALAAAAIGEIQSDDEAALPNGLTIAGMRVLVVDDQDDARAMLADLLSRYEAIVTTVASGAEALAVLSNTANDARPDVLVCDIAMPMEDGYTALRRMRALEAARGVAASQRIPAIALTALSGNEDRLRALSAGFQYHIAKPADPVELITVIANIAGMWRQN
jgi:PAS domain S-box-containing protein